MRMNLPLELINQLEFEKKELECQITEAQKKLKGINDILNQANGRRKHNWADYIFTCLSTHNRLMSTSDILEDIFHDNLNEISNPDSRRTYVMQLSLTLSRLCKSGRLVGYGEKGLKGKFYGLPAWEEKESFKDEYYVAINLTLEKQKANTSRTKFFNSWFYANNYDRL